MTILPIIARELKEQARRRSTYGLRMVGFVAVFAAAVQFTLRIGLHPRAGPILFRELHEVLFAAIWILIPFMTADCISQERRQGTLGLLFLTPLHAWDIVLAKGFIHAIRGFMIWLAVLPMMIVPILMGGVTGKEIIVTVLVDFSAVCWGLAAGLLASSFSKSRHGALAGAAFCGGILFLAFIFLHGRLMTYALRRFFPGTVSPGGTIASELFYGFFLSTDRDYALFFQSVGSQQQWLLLVPASLAVISIVVLLVCTHLAALRVRRNFADQPASRRKAWFQRTFCTPVVWLSLYRRWMRHKLENNPIGWLEQRTWESRLVTWSWLAVMISIYSFLLSQPFVYVRNVAWMQRILGQLLVGTIALNAAGSLRRERESGVLELLMVSPLRPAQIIHGRLRGLWGQFLPTMTLLVAVWLYFARVIATEVAPELVFYGMTYLTLPVIGLYCSLRFANVIGAFLMTLALGLVLPNFVARVLDMMPPVSAVSVAAWEPRILVAVCQSLLALLLLERLHYNLSHRRFALDRHTPA